MTPFSWSEEKSMENHWSAEKGNRERCWTEKSPSQPQHIRITPVSVSSNPDLNKDAVRGWNRIRLLKWSRISRCLGEHRHPLSHHWDKDEYPIHKYVTNMLIKINNDTLSLVTTNCDVLMTSSGAKTTKSDRGPRKSHQVFTMRNLRLLYKTTSQLFCFKSLSHIKQWIA